MNRTVVIVGFFLLILGGMMFTASLFINPNFHGFSSRPYPASNYSKVENGLWATYIPQNFTKQTSDIWVISNPSLNGMAFQFALVPSYAMNKVNATNFMQYNVVKPVNSTSQIDFNNVPSGSYVFVEPEFDIIAFGVSPQAALYTAGIISYSGGVLGVLGFITIIFGSAMRGRPPRYEF